MKTVINENNQNEPSKLQKISDMDILYDRNREFASGYDGQDLTILPQYSTIILSCMDSRVDPAHFLGLKPGEIFIMRNTGGRVTEVVERDLAFLWAMASQFTDGRSPGLSLAIVHHTDCGLEKLAKLELQLKISNKSGLDLKVLKNLSIADHDKSIKDDIAQLRESKIVPNELVVSGHLYNVQSGHLKEMVSPVPLKIGAGQ